MKMLAAMVAAAMLGTSGPAAVDPPAGPADASIDLATREGAALVKGTWRYSDVRVVEVDFRSPGPDLKPSGPANRTYDIAPHAGAADFDDSTWDVVDPTTLAARRSNGRLSFNWYRMTITIPERIDGFDPAGATVVFETVVDDYAEIWVDGQLPRAVGSTHPHLVRGWNEPNRVVIGRDVQPGQRIQIAIFGINGPLSDPPPNFIWIRSARLAFHRTPRAIEPRPVPIEVVRTDAALDAILPADVRLEQIAQGFRFTEGPLWHPDGYLLFSDPNANRIYRWAPGDTLEVFREQSGYTGADVGEYRQPGSNGLALDAQRRLTIDEHGNRRVTRLEADGSTAVLADRYAGRRLNSPNDLVYRSDGTLYFTDPPFGLPGFHADPRRELPHTGVYRLAPTGQLTLLESGLHGPNGIALSPDDRSLYVGNWDEKRKVVMRYPVRADGSVGNGEVFFDLTAAPGEEAIDGVKVDVLGNVYISGPGGLWIVSADGRHLGTLKTPELPANFAWGDADRRTLYLTARTGLYRLRLDVEGAGTWNAGRGRGAR